MSRHFPSPLPLSDWFTIIQHIIVDSLGIILNILLLIAIIIRSPRTLKSYKVLLINSALIDAVASVSTLMCIVRIMPTHTMLAYLYYGPCVYISGAFCHVMYTVMLHTLSQSLFLILTSFCYRLYVMYRSTPSTLTMIIVCGVVYIPNLMILVTFLFTLDDDDEVRALLRIYRPSYELDEYLVQGHTSIFNFLTMFTILAMTQPIGPTIIAILVIRRKVLGVITDKSLEMSKQTLKMHQALTHVLSLQAMLPSFFSVAVGSYSLCQFDILCSPFQEKLIIESVSIMQVIAPIISIYYMQPYRRFVANLFCNRLGFARKFNQEDTSTWKSQVSVI